MPVYLRNLLVLMWAVNLLPSRKRHEILLILLGCGRSAAVEIARFRLGCRLSMREMSAFPFVFDGLEMMKSSGACDIILRGL